MFIPVETTDTYTTMYAVLHERLQSDLHTYKYAKKWQMWLSERVIHEVPPDIVYDTVTNLELAKQKLLETVALFRIYNIRKNIHNQINIDHDAVQEVLKLNHLPMDIRFHIAQMYFPKSFYSNLHRMVIEHTMCGF